MSSIALTSGKENGRVATLNPLQEKERKMYKERDKFVGYNRNYGYTVAEFRAALPHVGEDGIIKEIILLDKPSCYSRLKNLRKGGYPHDQTLLAWETWPIDA